MEITMWALLAVCSYAVIVNKADGNPAPYIFGGTDITIDKFSSMCIMIYYSNDGIRRGWCSANIIKPDIILTSGHCVFENDENQTKGRFIIICGRTNFPEDFDPTSDIEPTQQTSDVVAIIKNKGQVANKVFLHNDLALMKTQYPFNLTEFIKPLTLGENQDDKDAIRSENCVMTGYGLTDLFEMPESLQQATVTFISNQDCNPLARDLGFRLNDLHMCSNDTGRSACFGDSGGIAGCYDKDGTFNGIAMISFGSIETPCNGVTVYTRLSKYKHWISKTVESLEQL